MTNTEVDNVLGDNWHTLYGDIQREADLAISKAKKIINQYAKTEKDSRSFISDLTWDVALLSKAMNDYSKLLGRVPNIDSSDLNLVRDLPALVHMCTQTINLELYAIDLLRKLELYKTINSGLYDFHRIQFKHINILSKHLQGLRSDYSALAASTNNALIKASVNTGLTMVSVLFAELTIPLATAKFVLSKGTEATLGYKPTLTGYTAAVTSDYNSQIMKAMSTAGRKTVVRAAGKSVTVIGFVIDWKEVYDGYKAAPKLEAKIKETKQEFDMLIRHYRKSKEFAVRTKSSIDAHLKGVTSYEDAILNSGANRTEMHLLASSIGYSFI